MPERYELLFRPEVQGDLEALGALHLRRVLAALEARLSLEPQKYGKPLGGSLAGLRRVRVGDHRIAYQVTGRRVVIWAVVHRKTVYAELSRRLGRA